MFKFVDANDGDVSALTDAEHDQVVDECYQCKLCYVKCPYVPPHEWELDFPRLMSRVHAVRQKQGVGVKERLTDQFLARTDAWAAPRSRRRRWSIGPPARRARGRAG
jgi:Fe-S oxidoreductase